MAEARLKARADMDTKGFDVGMAKMRNSVKSFTSNQLKSVAGMIGGAFAVGAIVNFGRQALQRADDLGNLAGAAGMSVEALQAMQWAMKEFGAATEESATAKIMKLVDAQGKVITGNKAMAEAFMRLGISEKEVASLNTDELMYRVAVGAKESGTAVSDLNLIFGRGAAFEMKDALDKLANEGMDNLITQAKNAGQVLDEELISKMGQLNDDLDRTSRQAGNFFVQVGAGASNFVKDFAALSSAILSVGFGEAERQYRAGEIGVAAERKGQQSRRDKEKAAKEAQKAAREQALADRKAAEAAELQSKIDKIRNDPMSISVGGPQASDNMARMGLFSGGQVNNSARMGMERQIKVQEEMAKRLRKIEELQQKTADNTARTVTSLEE